MRIPARQRTMAVAGVLFLIVFSAFVGPEAVAQRACTMENEAATCGALGPQFRCISNRCNLPPPIWNATGTGLGASGQTASFDVQGASRVRGNFTVGTTSAEGGDAGDLRVNAIYSRLGQDASDTLWLGGTNNLIRVQGRLTVDDGATVAGAAVLTQPAPCLANQVLKRNPTNTAWICAPDATGAAGGSVLWSQLAGFPAACGAGQFVTAIGSTLTCATPPAGGGVADHGALTGLADNDHPQYYRQTGDTRNLNVGDSLFTYRIFPGAGANSLQLGSNSGDVINILGDLRFGADGGTACNANQILKRNIGGTGWVCAVDEVGGGGGGGGGEPLYTTWYNNGNPTITGALTVSGAISSGGNIRAGGDLLANALFSRTAGADNIWVGDNDDTVQVQGALTVGGAVTVSGCLGPVVVGATAGPGVNGSQGGYRGIDALCNGAFLASHQCATNEVLTSIHCGAIWTDATKTVLRPAITSLIGVNAWIANGAPSLPTPTNDCYGWTQTGVLGGQQSQGIAWNFSVQGGAGYARPCNEQNRVLCCR